jgi:hypothetical protein
MAVMLLASGFGLVRAARVRSGAPIRRASAPPPSPANLAPVPDAPEMPSLIVGPPAPEPAVAPAAPGLRVTHGPNWRLSPLPPVPGFAGAIPAVPIRIERRPGDASAMAGAPPILPGIIEPGSSASPARPARSAETSAARPLVLHLRAVPSENSIQGPGEWLKIRASASVPCYVVIFHVTGNHHVRIVFPRRFDLVYEPNVSYTLLDRADPGENGEIVVAVASVYPMTAADALAAIRASRALAPSASRGPLAAELWEALEANLRGRAGGAVHVKQWEPHAWRVAMAMHRPPAPEAAPADSAAPQAKHQPGSTGTPPQPAPAPDPGDTGGTNPAPAPSGGEAPSRQIGGGSPP